MKLPVIVSMHAAILERTWAPSLLPSKVLPLIQKERDRGATQTVLAFFIYLGASIKITTNVSMLTASSSVIRGSKTVLYLYRGERGLGSQ